MTDEFAFDRRSVLLGATMLTSLAAMPRAHAATAPSGGATAETHLAEVSLESGATLTIERRGQIALFSVASDRRTLRTTLRDTRSSRQIALIDLRWTK